MAVEVLSRAKQSLHVCGLTRAAVVVMAGVCTLQLPRRGAQHAKLRSARCVARSRGHECPCAERGRDIDVAGKGLSQDNYERIIEVLLERERVAKANREFEEKGEGQVRLWSSWQAEGQMQCERLQQPWQRKR